MSEERFFAQLREKGVIGAALLFFAVCFFSFTNFSLAEEENRASGPDLSGVTLRIAAAGWNNAQGPIEAAGLTDYDYKVSFSVMQGGNLVMEALAANQINLGTGSQIPPLSASQAANGGNFKIFAIRRMNTLNQELIAGPRTGITRVEELKGKKVGYVKNTTAHYFLYKMLQNAGLRWEDVDTLALTTSDGLTALLTGDIDAFASYGNTVRTAKIRGASTILTADDILTGDYYFYATPAAIADSATHAAIVDYLDRYNRALEWCRIHPEKYAEWLSDTTNEDYDVVYEEFVEGEAQTKTMAHPLDAATVESEKDIASVFTTLGVLEGELDVDGLFDYSFAGEIRPIL